MKEIIDELRYYNGVVFYDLLVLEDITFIIFRSKDSRSFIKYLQSIGFKQHYPSLLYTRAEKVELKPKDLVIRRESMWEEILSNVLEFKYLSEYTIKVESESKILFELFKCIEKENHINICDDDCLRFFYPIQEFPKILRETLDKYGLKYKIEK